LSGCTPTETPADEQKNPHYQAGKERLSALDYKGAIDCFERAVEENPRSALAHFELGVLYDQHENDYAAALYHYNKALKLRQTGYPSDNIRQRIPACKQELIKADSLAVINPTVLRETERLREENQMLRKQIDSLQAYISGRPQVVNAAPVPTNYAGLRSTAATAPASGDRPRASLASSTSPTSPASPLSASSPSGARGRTHAIVAGETLAAVARRYQVKIPALLAANPGLDPKHLRVGQTVTVPTP
jgi:LysM repeat protein